MEKIIKKEFLRVKAIAEKLNADYNNGKISFDDAFDKLYTAFYNDEEMEMLDKDFGVRLDDDYEEEDGAYCITICGDNSLTYHEMEGLRKTQLVKGLKKMEVEKMEFADDFIDNFDSYLTSNISNVAVNDLVENPSHWYEYDEDIEDPILDVFNNIVEWLNATVEEREESLELELKCFIDEMFYLISKEIEYRG